MDDITAFKEIAPYLTHPLVWVGFVLFLFFGIHRALLKAGIIRPLDPRNSSKVVMALLRYGFVIALVALALGFLLEFRSHSDVSVTQQQVTGNGNTAIGIENGSTPPTPPLPSVAVKQSDINGDNNEAIGIKTDSSIDGK